MDVLLVQKSSKVSGMLRRMLGSLGHRVVAEAATCDEAISQLRSHRPQLAIVDLGVKDGGVGAYRRLLQSDARLPVIVVGSLLQIPELLESRKRGVRHFLLKPLREARLVEAIGALVTDVRDVG